jgi:hypothetical protein
VAAVSVPLVERIPTRQIKALVKSALEFMFRVFWEELIVDWLEHRSCAAVDREMRTD